MVGVIKALKMPQRNFIGIILHWGAVVAPFFVKEGGRVCGLH